MGAASRGLRENDDGSTDKVLTPEALDNASHRAKLVGRLAALMAAVATAAFVLLC
jgi:hypothetical protein